MFLFDSSQGRQNSENLIAYDLKPFSDTKQYNSGVC